MSEAYIYIDKVTFDYSKKNETRRKRRAKILLLRTGFRTCYIPTLVQTNVHTSP